MLGNEHLHFNAANLLLVIFVALGTLATAYGLAIIGSTSGQPNCMSLRLTDPSMNTDLL